jgi:hypothetical protein
MHRGRCFAWLVGALLLGSPCSLWAGSLVLEAEVMESAEGIAIPGAGSAQVRSALIHHKHDRDQAAFAQWLRGHQSGVVSFVVSDGNAHQAILHRLKHCFGRGLLLYADDVALAEKAVIRLELPVAP